MILTFTQELTRCTLGYLQVSIVDNHNLRMEIGTISQKMLATTLKSLENDGLVKRKLYPQVPPRVDYSLTSRGQSLIPHLHGLVLWADEHMKDIKKSRIKAEKIA